MKKFIVIAVLAFSTITLPSLVHAQCPPNCGFGEEITVTPGGGPSNFTELVGIFINLISATIPVLAGLAFLVFIWGLVKFIFRVGGDEKAVTEGKSLMIWGIIALFIMVSIWGIIFFLYRDIGFGPSLGLPLLPPNR